MDAAEMLRKQRAARRTWHELDEPFRRAVLVSRPSAIEMMRWRSAGSGADTGAQMVESCVVDWRGFTEADLIGAAVGGSDEVPFDRAVFAEWVGDEIEVMNAIANRIVELVSAHAEAKAAGEKKLGTS